MNLWLHVYCGIIYVMQNKSEESAKYSEIKTETKLENRKDIVWFLLSAG